MSTCKEVWLTVATGGRWTSEEIRNEVNQPRKDVERAIYAMSHGGMLTKFEGNPVRYGVTPDCITPRMTSVSELMKAMGTKT
jgi:hypothetical protein